MYFDSQQAIRPTVSREIFDGVHVAGYGTPINWSLSSLQRLCDRLCADKAPLVARISEVLRHHNIGMAFAPSANQFNALVAHCEEFTSQGTIPFSWRDNARAKLLRGIFADGIEIPPNTGTRKNAYMMSSADCALIVIKLETRQGPDRVFASHAGRASLYNPKRGNGMHSIVHELVKTFSTEERKRLRVWVGFSMNPGAHFSHTRTDSRFPDNGSMVDTIRRNYGNSCFRDDGDSYSQGWLDLKELIVRQFEKVDVQRNNITKDSVCTHTDVYGSGSYVWNSESRSPKQGLRNLIIAYRD